jgi:uncharacterized metal-binding protein YceD (DUF177 family)
LKQFTIQFASLEPGSYDFKFSIDNAFFEKFSESEITQGKLNVLIELQRQARMLILNFKITGIVRLTCDRCLDDFNQNIETEKRLIVKFGTETKEETDEIMTIPESEYSINVAQFIYEFIHLDLPTKRVHPDDEKGVSHCNKEIINKLEEYKNTDNIIEEVDPRWESLKKIKFN